MRMGVQKEYVATMNSQQLWMPALSVRKDRPCQQSIIVGGGAQAAVLLTDEVFASNRFGRDEIIAFGCVSTDDPISLQRITSNYSKQTKWSIQNQN